MKYQTLNAGDVRQASDEQKVLHTERYSPNGRNLLHPNVWRPVDLLGHAIVGGDLAHLEFRRPV